MTYGVLGKSTLAVAPAPQDASAVTVSAAAATRRVRASTARFYRGYPQN